MPLEPSSTFFQTGQNRPQSNSLIQPSDSFYQSYDFEDDENESKSREKNKKSFFDGLGRTYKQAYNDSIGGMMHQMMTGEKYYKLAEAPPSLVRDIAAGFLSFFASKEDLALLGASVVTGGAASVGTKALLKGATNTVAKKRAALMLAKRGGLGSKEAKTVVNNLVQIGPTQGMIMGLHDGFYDAAKASRDAIMLDEKFDIEKYRGMDYGQVLEEVTGNAKFKKFAGGGAIGWLAGGPARSLAVTPLAKKVPQGFGKSFARSGITYEAVTFGGLSPIVYEGRTPEFQDMAIAGGLVMALKLPPMVFGRGRKILNQRLQDEIETRDLARAAAVDEQAATRRTARGGRLTWRQFGNQRIMGQEVFFSRKKTGKVDADGNPEFKEIESLEKPVAIFTKGGERGAAKIVDGSFKHTDKGNTIKVDVITGGKQAKIKRTYQLDEKQTEKFFRNFADEESGLDYLFKEGIRDPKILRKLGSPLKDKKFMDNLYLQEVERHIAKINKQTDGYLKEDLEQALKRAGTEFSIGREKDFYHPLTKAVESGTYTSFDFSKLSAAELKYLATYLQEEKAIRKFVTEHATRYDNNYMYQTTGYLNKGPFHNILGALKPFYYQLTHPVAKKINRLMNNVNRGVQQKTAARLLKMDGVLKIARGQGKRNEKWYDDYIDGFGKVSAFDDYKSIRRANNEMMRKNQNITGSNNGFNKHIRTLRREQDKHIKNSYQWNNYENRIRFLKETRKITDEIYGDAKRVLGIVVAPYEAGYAPLMYRREVLDILFDRMKPMEKKVNEILKNNKIAAPNADGTYPVEVRQQLVDMVERTVKSFEGKKGKGDVEFTKIWKALKADASRAGKEVFEDDFDLYRALDMQLYQRALRPFSPLETPRMNVGNLKINHGDMVEFALRTNQEGILEQNMRNLFGEYVSGATKRIELARAFGRTGKYYQNLLDKVPKDLELSATRLPKMFGGQKIPLASQTEREGVDMLKQVFTGEINFNKSLTAAETFQTVANLEMIGKIALGFAVIPNITQTFISTAVEAGPLLTFRSILGMANPAKRKMVRQSGATILTAFDEMLMTDNALQIGAARSMKYGDATTSWTRNFMQVNNARDGIALATQKLSTPFAAINTLNQTIAAATAEQTIQKLTKIVSGKKTGFGLLDALAPKQRMKWAVDKLGRMGIDKEDAIKYADNIITGDYSHIAGKKIVQGKGRLDKFRPHPMKEKILQSMQKFSTQSQLQRDFMLDPYLFNDPYIKPLLLFKRFGYRQAQYSANTIERELIQGNIMPILNLGIGGFAGGQFVMWAKEKASEFLSGEPQYYGREARMKEFKKPEWQDFKNAISNVGAFGVMSDIMTDDDPISSLKFFLKPVMIDDFQRVIRSLDTFVGSMQTNYPDNWDVPFRKALIVGSPVAGGVISRVVRGSAETEEMRKNRIRARKREAVRDIKDLIIDGNPEEAAKLMNDFNGYAVGTGQTYLFGMAELKQHEYLSLIITPKDVGWSAIAKDWKDRLEKQELEKTKTY